MRLSSAPIVIFLILALVHSVSAESSMQSVSEILDRALNRYAEALQEPDRDKRIAMFAEAEYGFASAIDEGAENAALQINLGNAALQAEHMGQAMLAYHRALRRDPTAETARQNLAHIRKTMPDWVPTPGSADAARATAFYRRFSPANRSYAAAACFALGAICLAVSVRRREGAWRGLALAGGIAWALLIASIVLEESSQEASRAIITADEAFARSADSRLAALAYPDPLPSGVEVEVLEARAEWTRVRLHNGRDVWVRGSDVTRVGE